MPDYKFTQTGAEIQAILNKADAMGEHLYLHTVTISLSRTWNGITWSNSVHVSFISDVSTPVTSINELNTALKGGYQSLAVDAANGTDYSGNYTMLSGTYRLSSIHTSYVDNATHLVYPIYFESSHMSIGSNDDIVTTLFLK